MLRRFTVAALLCALLLLTGCTGADTPKVLSLFAMDTYMTLTAYGKDADEALSEAGRTINDLEQLLSRTREGSDVWQLNHNHTARLQAQTAALLHAALQYAADTDGAFDVTVAPLVEAWNITGETPRVPSEAELAALLPLVGSEHVHFSGALTTLDADCGVDLGGIAKGYASDQVAAVFAAHGIKSGAVSLGGNVYVCGSRPDGTPWRVAVKDPRGDGFACTLALRDAFAVTSGAYQRSFTAPDGTVYHHILNPATGAPALSDLLSVTVVCDQGTMADAYSTALFVMGQEGAEAFWRKADGFSMVLITADGRVRYTPDLADQLTKQEGVSYVYESIPR